MAEKNVPAFMSLSPTPCLPKATSVEYVHVSGEVRLWYAVFGPPLKSTHVREESPVVLLHGAHASSDYWGYQIEYLLKHEPGRTTIAIDSRLIGRPSYGDMITSFAIVAADTIAVLDYLHVEKAAIVGWSNGAVILVSLLMNYPSRGARIRFRCSI